jgi:hypothetical protein
MHFFTSTLKEMRGQFHTLTALPLGKDSLVPLNRRMGVQFGEKEHSLSLSVTEP